MVKTCVSLCLLFLLASACGGKVAFDSGASSSGSSSSGGGGAVGFPVACPGPPGTFLTDDQITPLVGKPCDVGAECNNNNGCGGCFISCQNGVWAAEYPDQGGVCWSLENC